MTDRDLYKPSPRKTGHYAKVLILTADKTEDLEVFYPYYRFLEEGFDVEIATPNGGAFEGKEGLGLKDSRKLAEVEASGFDLLFIPGGKAPEALKKNADAISLVQEFVNTGKPVAAICHGPQVLAAADVIRNRRIAAWPECREEVEQAGAEFIDQECVQDGLFITARWPADLPAFTHAVLSMVNRKSAHNHNREAA